MLTVTDLRVRYGAVKAVQGASLRVDAGEIVGLIGPNGAGKTSTLHGILGLRPVAGGTVTFNERSLAGTSTAQRIAAGLALVPQGREVFPNLSVADNIRVGSWIRRKGAARPDVDRLLRAFPVLAERSRQLAGTLSGGEQQMLALVRALASQPTCVLFDEPSMGLSPLMVSRVAASIKDMVAESGITALVVDQGLGIVRRITSRVYVMVQGRIVDERETASIGDGIAVERAYFG